MEKLETGKLPKNNQYSVKTVSQQQLYQGWATKQGGKRKTWKKRYFVLYPLPTNNNKKTLALFYFQNDKSKAATGVIKITEGTKINSIQNKGKTCIAIESGMISARVYLMYCSTPVEQETMANALKREIENLKPKKDLAPASGGSSTGAGTSAGGASAGHDGSSHNTELKKVLDNAKNFIPFLSTASGSADDRVLEFLGIWTDSIPATPENIQVCLVMNTDMSQLSWRVHGPQSVLIQEMVDFFWNVGAPEQEIDRLNEVGGLINPLTIGSWIDMSTKGGMDGGWLFPVTVSIADALKACDEGSPLKKLTSWTQNNNIKECVTVGRDMGASPPRQTEIRFNIKGDSFDARLNMAASAYSDFGFPVLPDSYLNILRKWNPTSMLLSVVTSSDGFVRIGMILPNPDRDIITQICACGTHGPTQVLAFQDKMKIERPAFVEFQYLNESFGYGVYNEGLNVVFHFNLEYKQ